MQSFVVFASVLACAFASPQFLAHPGGFYNGFGYSGLGYAGLGYSNLGYAGLGYTAAAPAVTYAAAPAVVAAPAFSKTQYHAQDELGQSSHGYAYPGQAAAETRDAAGNVRGSYSYVDPNGKVVQTNYIADAVNGFRVESNALPVGPVAGPVHVAALPAPVQDTPEVVQAKIEHAAAHAAARSLRKRRGAVLATGYTGFPVAAHGYAYSSPLAYHTAVASPLAYHATAVASPVTYAAAAAPLTTYGYTGLGHLGYAAHHVAAVPAVRAATLTKIVNNPGHAVSYRVD